MSDPRDARERPVLQSPGNVKKTLRVEAQVRAAAVGGDLTIKAHQADTPGMVGLFVSRRLRLRSASGGSTTTEQHVLIRSAEELITYIRSDEFYEQAKTELDGLIQGCLPWLANRPALR